MHHVRNPEPSVGGIAAPEPYPDLDKAVVSAKALRAALVPGTAGSKYLLKNYPTVREKTHYIKKHIFGHMHVLADSMDGTPGRVNHVASLHAWLSQIDAKSPTGKVVIDYITTILCGVKTSIGINSRGIVDAADLLGLPYASGVAETRRLTPTTVVKLLHPDNVAQSADNAGLKFAAKLCFDLLELLKRKGARSPWFVAVPFDFNPGPVRSVSMPALSDLG